MCPPGHSRAWQRLTLLQHGWLPMMAAALCVCLQWLQCSLCAASKACARCDSAWVYSLPHQSAFFYGETGFCLSLSDTLATTACTQPHRHDAAFLSRSQLCLYCILAWCQHSTAPYRQTCFSGLHEPCCLDLQSLMCTLHLLHWLCCSAQYHIHMLETQSDGT